MIIDARQTLTAPHGGRPYNLSTAVLNAIMDMAPGDCVEVSAMLDQFGKDVPRPRLDMLVTKHKATHGLRMAVRKPLDPSNVARLIRME